MTNKLLKLIVYFILLGIFAYLTYRVGDSIKSQIAELLKKGAI